MPFGQISSQSITYDPRSPGVYQKTGLAFSDPKNEFQLRGYTGSKDGFLRSAVTRVLQKDVTVGSETLRKTATVEVRLVVEGGSGFTPTEIDSLATDCSNFLSTDTISRLFAGEV